jgi:epoxide hydrolase
MRTRVLCHDSILPSKRWSLHETQGESVPIGLSSFAEDFQAVRPLAERDHHNIVSWNEYPRGSHWATHDAPDLLLEDIRQFFRRFPEYSDRTS